MKEQIQLPMEFSPRSALGKDDFLVAPCNEMAVQMLDMWPNWSFFALSIYGEEGAGKTHLANVFSHMVSLKFPQNGKTPVIKGSDLTVDMPPKLFVQNPCVIIEDADKGVDEEAMFHLFNLYREEGGFMLLTSRIAPSRWNIKLPDLKSRLSIIPTAEITEPDDMILSALLVKLFDDRQLPVSPDVIGYMIKYMERSFSFAYKLVAEVDRVSLAKKRSITIPIVKEAFEILQNKNQEEFDF